VVLEDTQLWMISKNDGQLYGLNLIYSKKELEAQNNNNKK
jgi:hypothetical protein